MFLDHSFFMIEDHLKKKNYKWKKQTGSCTDNNGDLDDINYVILNGFKPTNNFYYYSLLYYKAWNHS